jgi:hypothetical protein
MKSMINEMGLSSRLPSSASPKGRAAHCQSFFLATSDIVPFYLPGPAGWPGLRWLLILGGQFKTGSLWTAQNRQFRRRGRDW